MGLFDPNKTLFFTFSSEIYAYILDITFNIIIKTSFYLCTFRLEFYIVQHFIY